MRVLPLLIALALSFGPSEQAFAGPGDDDHLSTFLSSDYTVCDAHFVAKTFDFDLTTAKAYIGQKIAWGTTSILQGDLEAGRSRGLSDPSWRCRFHMLPLTYDDAEALAAFWGVSVAEAKTFAEDKVHYGNERYLLDTVVVKAREALGEGSEHGVEESSRQANYDAFVSSRYDVCHANMLVGTYFGESLAEVKDLLGYKAANGYHAPVDSMLEKVRAEHQGRGSKPCAFYQTPYTYDDAVLLAKAWGTDVAEAKGRVEQKYLYGSETIVRDVLVAARAGQTNPDAGSDEGTSMKKGGNKRKRKRGR